ncbi:hypothetical protein SAMN04487926_105290 [Paraburkholderia steynii]|uniref:Uncharacterized protein n=1 Tax=Paraburkholderia steynii TaxID=1245441 RepID=A0A7Z7FHQ5_9BURK|nr:hypothetical protein [Paraburkholderia steynii]SDH55830.1 hypothetical protein SAMN04487926_105290 [Paraburkholderia steynii]
MKIDLSRQAIRNLIAQKFPRLKRDSNDLRDAYFLDFVRRGKNSTRIVRVLPTGNADVCQVKLSVSSLAGVVRPGEILDAEQLAEAVAEEILRFEEGVPGDDGDEVFGSSVIESTKDAKSPAGTAQRRALSKLQVPAFEYRTDDVDCLRGLIYFFEILSADGVQVSSYVGQSLNSNRPLQHYAKRTAQVLAGVKGRPVHEALGDAIRAGGRVVCTLLCNAAPHEIDEVETALIRELDCHGPGMHQLNRQPGPGPHGRPTPERLLPIIARVLERRRCQKG